MTDINSYMQTLGSNARTASADMAVATRGDKDAALFAIANRLEAAAVELITANAKDLDAGAKPMVWNLHCWIAWRLHKVAYWQWLKGADKSQR